MDFAICFFLADTLGDYTSSDRPEADQYLPELGPEPGSLGAAAATVSNSPDDSLQERQLLKKSRRVQDLSCCSTPQLNTEQGKYQS